MVVGVWIYKCLFLYNRPGRLHNILRCIGQASPHFSAINASLNSTRMPPILQSSSPSSNSLSTYYDKSYTTTQLAQSSLSPPHLFSHPLHPISHSSPFPNSHSISCPNKDKTHLIKTRHRLIRTPYLNLKIRRLIPLTPLFRTLHLSLLRIIPRSRPAKHIFAFGASVHFALVDALGQNVLVGTG
jgi:hypothetical protein